MEACLSWRTLPPQPFQTGCSPARSPSSSQRGAAVVFAAASRSLLLFLLYREESVLSPVQLFTAPWTSAHQAPLSMGFTRHEYWSGLPFRSPRNLPDPGIEPRSLAAPALAGRFFTTSATWNALVRITIAPYARNHFPLCT